MIRLNLLKPKWSGEFLYYGIPQDHTTGQVFLCYGLYHGNVFLFDNPKYNNSAYYQMEMIKSYHCMLLDEFDKNGRLTDIY